MKGNSDFQSIELAIPAENLKALRLDPLEKPGFLKIQKVSLKSADKAIPIPFEQFVPANHIAVNKIQDGVLYLETTPNATKIHRELGWKPQESFETGIRKTIQWYLDNQEWVRNVTSGDYKKWVEKNFSKEWNMIR